MDLTQKVTQAMNLLSALHTNFMLWADSDGGVEMKNSRHGQLYKLLSNTVMATVAMSICICMYQIVCAELL